MLDVVTSPVGLYDGVHRQSICWPPVTLIAWPVM